MADEIPIVMWGAGGQARVIDEFLPTIGYRLAVVVDHDAGVAWHDAEAVAGGLQILNGWSGLADYLERAGEGDAGERGVGGAGEGGGGLRGIVAIGGHDGSDRLRIQTRLEAMGVEPIAAVHPRAFVAHNAEVGAGTVVLAQSAVCAMARVGRACIINTGASVDHDCVLGDGVHVAPGARLAGAVAVGDHAMVGSGAVVLPGVSIGAKVVVGAGAVVTRDVPAGKVVYGNPARVVRDISRMGMSSPRRDHLSADPATPGGARFLVEGQGDDRPASETES